ncbi:hypothetical protein HYH02_015146 [Chlamydomonas schloesseri]|uniref:SRCR domain-containing protein n=1 Tax=Chlamydomonas schloesseri TaxID=2026947 RepID=A0A835SPY4_9CHLO|nr:hypothetical protein HYH02_015146 [Chlamydomonas schloesseri]|eukprot:KAG2424665.1 hypothetical protein HYH02_015146 [Chlamydomonas schloesseri]
MLLLAAAAALLLIPNSVSGQAVGGQLSPAQAEALCNATSDCVAWNSYGYYLNGRIQYFSAYNGLCVYVKAGAWGNGVCSCQTTYTVSGQQYTGCTEVSSAGKPWCVPTSSCSKPDTGGFPASPAIMCTSGPGLSRPSSPPPSPQQPSPSPLFIPSPSPPRPSPLLRPPSVPLLVNGANITLLALVFVPSPNASAPSTFRAFNLSAGGGLGYAAARVNRTNAVSVLTVSVCLPGWSDTAAAFACQGAGFRTGWAVATDGSPGAYPNVNRTQEANILTDVVCPSNAASLAACTAVLRTGAQGMCGSMSAVYCSGDPANGALRLMEYTVDKVGNGHGGEPPLIGRWYEAPAAFGGMRGGFVQMWSAATGQWGTVCSDGWDDNDAQVACRALGFSYGKAGYEKYPPSGSSDNYFFRWKQMFMTQVACTGKERSILESRLLPPSPPPSPPSAAAINPFGCYNASTLPAAGITVAVYMNYTSSVANLTLANCAAAARSSSSNSNSSSNSSSSSPLRVPAYVALAVTNNDPLTSRYMCIGLQLPGDKVQLNATAAAAAARLPSLDACANGGRRSCTAGAGNLPQQQVPCNGGTKKALEVLAVYDLGALGKGF